MVRVLEWEYHKNEYGVYFETKCRKYRIYEISDKWCYFVYLLDPLPSGWVQPDTNKIKYPPMIRIGRSKTESGAKRLAREHYKKNR